MEINVLYKRRVFVFPLAYSSPDYSFCMHIGLKDDNKNDI